MLPLPEDLQDKLAKECRFAADKLRTVQDPIGRLFYFSAMHSEISRILNWHWDQDLALLHTVLQTLHGNLNARVGLPSTAGLYNHLPEIADNLATYIDGRKDNTKEFHTILKRIASVNYAATPHGHYITEKGLIKF